MFRRQAEITNVVVVGAYCTTPLRLSGFFFSCSHGTNAEGLGTIAEQNQSRRPDVGELIIIFGGEENDFVFLHNALFSVDRLNGALTIDHEKSFRRLVIVHGSTVTWLEV